jgi:hypothetical protein
MRSFVSLAAIGIACCIGCGTALADDQHPAPAPATATATAYIIWPTDGAVIPGGKFWLRMGLSGAGIAPAGVNFPNTGHHHLIIDADLPPLDQPIPNDKNHLHFGAGQTEVRIELPPGKHTLQLMLGDADHMTQNPPIISKKITITVPQS